MKAIRGATTIERDDPECVRKEVSALLSVLTEKNDIDRDDIVAILFSQTQDIKSMYAAKAARECGFSSTALYSSSEPDIKNSLKLCIRVMILAENVKAVRPVYLNKAKILRLDVADTFAIALDGPAGSGKSTLAKSLAKEFDILYLDTGAMYRAVALACIRNSIDDGDEFAVCEMLKGVDISVKYLGGTQITLMNGEDVGDAIRTGQVSMVASTVSRYAGVREKMVSLQREIASTMSCVLDGRDIGTYVLPDAKFKFYINASPEIRAERRLREYENSGLNENYEDILRDIKRRDRQDETREIAPLRKAEDAIEVDTSAMTAQEVIDHVREIIQDRL